MATREDLLAATQRNLETIKARVDASRPMGKDMIGVAVGMVVNTYKVAKHFELFITGQALAYHLHCVRPRTDIVMAPD